MDRGPSGCLQGVPRRNFKSYNYELDPLQADRSHKHRSPGCDLARRVRPAARIVSADVTDEGGRTELGCSCIYGGYLMEVCGLMDWVLSPDSRRRRLRR